MNHSLFASESEAEKDHWWFVGRRRFIAGLIRDFKITRSSKIIEIGCGSGAILRMLSELGFLNTTGIDKNPIAIEHCKKKGLLNVLVGDARALPQKNASCDLIIAADVLEHIHEDDRVVAEVYRVLKPGGIAILTVPAFNLFWSPHDVALGHVRRYRREQFAHIVTQTGLEKIDVRYFNFLLALPILLVRIVLSQFKKEVSDEIKLSGGFLNQFLTKLFALDIRLASLLHLPFGVSLLCIARKPLLEKDTQELPIKHAV